jgi:hypothetical protein
MPGYILSHKKTNRHGNDPVIHAYSQSVHRNASMEPIDSNTRVVDVIEESSDTTMNSIGNYNPEKSHKKRVHAYYQSVVSSPKYVLTSPEKSKMSLYKSNFDYQVQKLGSG